MMRRTADSAGATPSLLVAEDGEMVIRALGMGLLKMPHPNVRTAGSAQELAARLHLADIAVLDASLPWLDVHATCEEVRRSGSATLVMVVGVAPYEVARVAVLDAGADDCLSTTTTLAELMARLRAMIRGWARSASARTRQRSEPLVLLPDRHGASVYGTPVQLTRREYQLLETMLTAPGRVHSRDTLIDSVWTACPTGRAGAGEPSRPTKKAVDVTIARLRNKLVDAGAAARITAIRGIGYRLDTGEPTVLTRSPSDDFDDPA